MCVDGVDYICVDQQHGLVDYAEMVEMLRAIEGRRTAVPLTRVPVNQALLAARQPLLRPGPGLHGDEQP